jgi:ParB-like nuclease domain
LEVIQADIMGFLDIAKGLLKRINKDILHLIHKRKRPVEFNPDLLINPAKYARPLATKKIVADQKISRQGVDFYKQKILKKEKINPIIVVKHPRKDMYAVLDGHHRYYAYRELGVKYICSALAGDYSSVIFYLTEQGYFQPSSQVTDKIRQPAKEFHQNLREFLDKFLAETNSKQ